MRTDADLVHNTERTPKLAIQLGFSSSMSNIRTAMSQNYAVQKDYGEYVICFSGARFLEQLSNAHARFEPSKLIVHPSHSFIRFRTNRLIERINLLSGRLTSDEYFSGRF